MNNDLKKFEINKKYPKYETMMRFGVINDKIYSLEIDNNYNIYILTEEMINSSSILKNNSYYATLVDINMLDDIIIEHLYAEYKEKIYKVIGVNKEFEKIILGTRGIGYVEEDKKLGFSYDDYIGALMLEVKKDEIKMYSKTESIYEGVKVRKEIFDNQKKTL